MLKVTNLRVSYGRTVVLRELDLEAAAGVMTCVVGPNGAGKSTLMAAIAGGVPVVSGDIRLDGKPIAGLSAEAISRLGVALVPEGRHVFSTLTVDENLLVGALRRTTPAQRRQDRERMLTIFPRLGERLGLPANRLSGGEQQMLVIARSLMTRPRLLMVDEPSLGLAPRIVEQVFDVLRQLRDEEGLTLLVNEQSSARVLRHAQRLLVLRGGEVRLEIDRPGAADEGRIHHAYFGYESRPEGEGVRA